MTEDGESGSNSSDAEGRPEDRKRRRDVWGRKLTPEGAVEKEESDPSTLGEAWPWMLPKERERAIQDDPEAVRAAGLSLDDPYAPESTVEYNLDQDLDPDIQIPVGESVWEWERRMLGLPDEEPPWLVDPSMDRDTDYVPPLQSPPPPHTTLRQMWPGLSPEERRPILAIPGYAATLVALGLGEDDPTRPLPPGTLPDDGSDETLSDRVQIRLSVLNILRSGWPQVQPIHRRRRLFEHPEDLEEAGVEMDAPYSRELPPHAPDYRGLSFAEVFGLPDRTED